MPIRSLGLAALALATLPALAPAAAQRRMYAPPPPRYHAYEEGGPGWAAREYYPDRDARGYRDGRPRRRCDRGTGGTILGAIAGGLLGNGIAGRGDRTIGTIAGAGAGALAGRAIDRGC